MFKRTRRKIVAAIMMVFVLLWLGTLSLIYASSYSEMVRHNREMLEERAEIYEFPQTLEDSESIPDELPEGPEDERSAFYIVAVSYDGEILDVENDSPHTYSDEKLKERAQHVIKGNKNYGLDLEFAYYKADKGEYTLVIFKDNVGMNGGVRILFRYMLSFGVVTLVFFFFLSVFLARKIVAPLEKNYQKQKRFISDAGHELKTPVAVVNVNAELLSREIGDNQWLQNILHENERMDMLVSQMLELARTENVTPQMEEVDFSRIISGEALLFESVAFEKGLVLNSNITDSIIVEGNSIQLRQIGSILLDNAIRYSKEPGEIRLTVTKEYGFAKLSVINKGEEIPVEQRKQIFERFYRVDTVRNGEDKHYGLGLAIAKAIILSHKGQIEVQCYNGLIEFIVKIPTL